MTKEIIKYTTHYVVHFKEELKFEPVQISEEAFRTLENLLKQSEFVKIGWVLHNKYNISYIKPYELEDSIINLLKNESESVRENVKKEMKLYKNKLTPWVVQNMIDKYN